MDNKCKFCGMELYGGHVVVDISEAVSLMTPQMKPYRSVKSYKYCDQWCALGYAKRVAETRLGKRLMKAIKERMVEY